MRAMKTAYWWNVDFEALIGTMREWLAQRPNIDLVNVDWKYVQPQGQQGKWWLLLFYRETA